MFLLSIDKWHKGLRLVQSHRSAVNSAEMWRRSMSKGKKQGGGGGRIQATSIQIVWCYCSSSSSRLLPLSSSSLSRGEVSGAKDEVKEKRGGLRWDEGVKKSEEYITNLKWHNWMWFAWPWDDTLISHSFWTSGVVAVFCSCSAACKRLFSSSSSHLDPSAWSIVLPLFPFYFTIARHSISHWVNFTYSCICSHLYAENSLYCLSPESLQ